MQVRWTNVQAVDVKFLQDLRSRKNFLKMLNEMCFYFVYLHHCAFAANLKEITVNNVASTFDNADHSSQN